MLNAAGHGLLGKLAQSITASLRRLLNELLRDAADRELPVLFCYGSDGWGTKMTSQHDYNCGTHVVRREGKVYTEFLLERAVLKSIAPDMSVRMAMEISAPRGMSEGKTGWHIWAAACDYKELVRFSAPRSIILSVYLQDGLHVGAATRRMQARHEIAFSNLLGAEVDF